MAPSAPKTGYCQAEFFAQLFQKVDFFKGSRKVSLISVSASYFRDPFWDLSNLDEAVRNEAGCHRLRGFEAFSRTHIRQTNKQTRTRYLGTGVAD